MIAVLGVYTFTLLKMVNSVNMRESVDFAEHQFIGKKSSLEFLGENLKEIDISVGFYLPYCVPLIEHQLLNLAMKKQTVLPFVLGTGVYLGKYVITEMNTTAEIVGSGGQLDGLECQIKLKEAGNL